MPLSSAEWSDGGGLSINQWEFVAMLAGELLSKVKKIEIKTRRLVDEITGGAYHSVFKGRGIEFSEVREYTPEDDVRDIDWNVSARMGSPYVKKYMEERELTVLLLVDVSASGAFGSAEKTKRRTAAELAALLAFSAGHNGDKVGLLMFSDRIELFVPPRSGRRHTLRLIREMLAFEPQSKGTDIDLALRETLQVLKKKSVVFLLSDLITDRPFENSLKNADVFRLTYSAPGGHGIFHFRAAGVCRYSFRICGRRVKSNARHIVPCRALFGIFSGRFPPKPCQAVPGSRSVLFAGLHRRRRHASYFLSSSLLNSSSVTLLCSSVIMPL